jgi:hypothetical protein
VDDETGCVPGGDAVVAAVWGPRCCTAVTLATTGEAAPFAGGFTAPVDTALTAWLGDAVEEGTGRGSSGCVAADWGFLAVVGDGAVVFVVVVVAVTAVLAFSA